MSTRRRTSVGIDAVLNPAGESGAGAGDRAAPRHDRRLRGHSYPGRDGDLRGAGERAREPRPGDQLAVDGQTFVIQGEPERRDPDRRVWTVDVRPT